MSNSKTADPKTLTKRWMGDKSGRMNLKMELNPELVEK